MKRLLSILFLLASVSALAVDRVVVTLTITNTPAVGDTFTLNSSTRTWTNATASATIQTNTTTGNSGTNLFSAFGSYGVSGVAVSQSASNVVVFTGLPGVTMSASLATAWGTISYATNTITTAQVLRVPMSVEATASRTNMASQLIRDLGAYSPTPFSTGTVAMSLFMDLPNPQTVTGAKIFSSITTTSLVNRGNAISSVGSGTDSEQFGTSSVATNTGALAVGQGATAGGVGSMAIGNAATAVTGDGSTAVGNAATATGTDSLAVGTASSSTRPSSVAVGNSSSASGTNAVSIGASAQASGTSAIALGAASEATNDGIAIGTGAEATADNSMAIGQSAVSSHADSIVIGAGLTSTETHQVQIGGSAHTVKVPGMLWPGSITNTTYYGTVGLLSGGTIASSTLTSPTATSATLSNTTANGTTDIKGLQLPRNTHTSLANGANSGVIITNTFTRISAGPTLAFSIAGLAGGADGRTVILYNSTGQNMTISHESGTEATAANRIITMTGSDVATTGNGSAILVYDSSASRWILIASEL